MNSNKNIFINLWIPTVIIFFFSMPLLVLFNVSYFFPDQVKYFDMRLDAYLNDFTVYRYINEEKQLNSSHVIPLLFVLDEYPSNGRMKFRLHERRWLILAENLEKQKHRSLGYIHIHDAEITSPLPQGELLEITHFEWTESGCILTTERKTSFRVKHMLPHETTEITYGMIETI